MHIGDRILNLHAQVHRLTTRLPRPVKTGIKIAMMPLTVPAAFGVAVLISTQRPMRNNPRLFG